MNPQDSRSCYTPKWCICLSQMETQKLNEADRNVTVFALEQLTKMRDKGFTPEQFDHSRMFLD
jgi:hypothetical protein